LGYAFLLCPVEMRLFSIRIDERAEAQRETMKFSSLNTAKDEKASYRGPHLDLSGCHWEIQPSLEWPHCHLRPTVQ
jgi:hypothetical protein